MLLAERTAPALCSNGKCGTSTAAKALSEPGGTFVDAALSFYESFEGFGMELVFLRVPQHARPLRPRPFVDLGRIGRAADNCGKRVLMVKAVQVLKS
jgi:hypothetical protein